MSACAVSSVKQGISATRRMESCRLVSDGYNHLGCAMVAEIAGTKVPSCARRSVNAEVFGGGLSVDEISVVFGIEDSLVDVFSRKGDDRIMVVPEADS